MSSPPACRSRAAVRRGGQEKHLSRTLFLIPARGGSKGVPGKNLRTVGGIPLIGRAVRTARAALAKIGGDGKVVVSTDSEEIARVARDHGAETPFLRPAELAGDETPTIPVVLHALDTLACDGFIPDTVVLLQATAPLLSIEDITGCLALFRRSEGRPAVTVRPSASRSDLIFRLEGTRLVRSATPLSLRRQDQAPEVSLAGSVYVATPAWLRDQGHWVTDDRTQGFLVDASRAHDIDDELDFTVNEALLRTLRPWRDGHVLVVAEAGVNHNGDLGRALEMIDVAAEAGADAVKFQMFDVNELVTDDAPQAAYQQRNTGTTQSMKAMLASLRLDRAQFEKLQARCDERKIAFSASVFDLPSVDLLEEFAPGFVKIPSGEITNLPLLHRVALTGRPVLLSTGMSTLAEVTRAVDELTLHGTMELCVMHCVSDYPARLESSNLRCLQTLASALQLPVGLSDHTIGREAAVMSIALGAVSLEKHYTLDHSLPGPDHVASADPSELKAYVAAVRAATAALGTGRKVPVPEELATARVARKSLVYRRPLEAGSTVSPADLTTKRPGTGISPMDIAFVTGRRLRHAVTTDQLVDWRDIE